MLADIMMMFIDYYSIIAAEWRKCVDGVYYRALLSVRRAEKCVPNNNNSAVLWLPAYVSIMYRADGWETMVRNAESKKYVTYNTDEIKEEEYTTKLLLLLLLFFFFLFSLCSVVEIPS